MLKFVVRLCLILGLIQPVMAFAEDAGGGEYGTRKGYSNKAPAGLSNSTTNRVARLIQRSGPQCQRLDKVYRYDCYRVAYTLAAREMEGKAAYAEAYKAVAKVANLLNREVSRNLDRKAPAIQRRGQTFRPVTPQAAPKIKAKATRAIEEAETTLLRSASSKGNHYTKIAAALNSNKVLLRAMLRLLPGMRAVLTEIA
ncbi:MAG: hypothetical protein AB3N23_07125 [Paracoccaceae bacterium]